MGLIKKYQDYKEKSRLKRIERAAKLIKNPKATKDDRWAALEFFSSLDDPAVSVPALLERFEFSLEHGILDTREKELALEGILKCKDACLDDVRGKLVTTTKIAWPLKVLSQLASEEVLVKSLTDTLNFEDVSFDQGAVDKNYDVLCYLRDYQLSDVAIKIAHFLKDPDERVRFACAEVLIEQDQDMSGVLEPFLLDDSSENRRIKQSVITAFIDKKWQAKDIENLQTVLAADGVNVGKNGVLSGR